MTAPSPAFLDRLDAAAKAAQAAEIAFRNTIAAEIARHERERQYAFRRLGLARALAAAVTPCAEEEAAVAAGAASLKAELGWHTDTETRTRILEAFRPVTLAAWALTRPEPEAGEEAAAQAHPPCDPAAVETAFAAFEAWYRAEIGEPFLALLDQEIPEMPVVEF